MYIRERITQLRMKKGDSEYAMSLKPVSYTHLDVYKRQGQLHADFALQRYGNFCDG